jgi:hypothetical protein
LSEKERLKKGSRRAAKKLLVMKQRGYKKEMEVVYTKADV